MSNLQDAINELAETLDEIGIKVDEGAADNRKFVEWNVPVVYKNDLSDMSYTLGETVRGISAGESNTEIVTNNLNKINAQMHDLYKSAMISHIFNGHHAQAIPAFIGTFQWLNFELQKHFTWERLGENDALPKKLKTRLRSVQTELDSIETHTSKINVTIKEITDARQAAVDLPTDLASLNEARLNVKNIQALISQVLAEVQFLKYETEAELKRTKTFAQTASTESIAATGHKLDAEKYALECEKSRGIITTVGLAASFEAKTNELKKSVRLWFAALTGALLVGASIGAWRLHVVADALNNPAIDSGRVFIHIVLSLINLGAPLWVAWIATVQIGQRFRLAEDYGFKASVAKAYEGYRKQAENFDDTFQARLFSAALQRLEEAPLRLIDTQVHGSPWHELTASSAFREAIQTVPSLKDKFFEVLNFKKPVQTPQNFSKPEVKADSQESADKN